MSRIKTVLNERRLAYEASIRLGKKYRYLEAKKQRKLEAGNDPQSISVTAAANDLVTNQMDNQAPPKTTQENLVHAEKVDISSTTTTTTSN
ncbi:hypothetical protein AX774_g2024 [Zancudomyces culisetae]|uniref:Uncharacterized protein n=1 Tax=Zancudomyces culisetae TaxID=1213189 RepID=A0A1R1PU28_ZANCU|nr:hypothetical protein AX774_g2181 [Zancudomyces culisetae]OMH84454.1 hypothetical protein AX774_g2024 [Zancudomyces culisetae]|eukprot:OMH84306.1 hypothetical protein AX774_g2181 [Zancudomyces culisetae]